MPSHEERALELVEFQDSLRALSEPVVTELQEAIAQALEDVEREAYERAAKVAEAEERTRNGEQVFPCIAIAAVIRALSRNETGGGN